MEIKYINRIKVFTSMLNGDIICIRRWNMEEYLTPEEVAEILKVSNKAILDWLRSGNIPGTKVGRLWRIPKADLETWLESNTQRPRPAAEVVGEIRQGMETED